MQKTWKGTKVWKTSEVHFAVDRLGLWCDESTTEVNIVTQECIRDRVRGRKCGLLGQEWKGGKRASRAYVRGFIGEREGNGKRERGENRQRERERKKKEAGKVLPTPSEEQ